MPAGGIWEYWRLGVLVLANKSLPDSQTPSSESKVWQSRRFQREERRGGQDAKSAKVLPELFNPFNRFNSKTLGSESNIDCNTPREPHNMNLVKRLASFTAIAVSLALAASGGDKVIKDGDTLVFMGDSITQFGKNSVDGYLRLVVQGLAANGIDVKWHGVGISGQTAVQMKNRFKADVLDRHPNVVTIFAGVNDCAYGWPSKTDSTPDDVAAMADMAIKAGITPVLLSPTCVSGEGFRQDSHDYAAAVKDIAQAKGIPYAATHEAFRAYLDDPVNPVINVFGRRATSDGTHMDVVGNHILAREVLKAFGLDQAEMDKAEAAWNANPPFIAFHPVVKVTEAEYAAVKAAAKRAGKSLGGYHDDLFFRGVELMKKAPAKVVPSSGATITLSATPIVSLVTYDEMIDCGRKMPDHDSLPSVVNYAMLAAVHELPPATDADLLDAPGPMVDASPFAKSIEFTCSGYSGSSTLSNFPVAVRLADGSPAEFAYTDMADPSSGDELRFADAGGHSLPYEIENWDTNGTSLVWVGIPALAKGTKFTMLYGGTPADMVAAWRTWAADYVGVWHMAEDGGVAADSVNGIDAKPEGVAASRQAADMGVFGKARVNSTDSRNHLGQSMLKVPDSTLLDVGDDFTFSGWVKMTAPTKMEGIARIASRNRGAGNYPPDWEIAITGYDTLNVYAGSTKPVFGTMPSAETNWVHVAGVFNGPNMTAYANGEKLFDAPIAAVKDTDNKLVFGSKDGAEVKGHLTGLMDEFRLRDAISTADWIKAEYDQSKTTFLEAQEIKPSRQGRQAIRYR